jgi:hypothetical protein
MVRTRWVGVVMGTLVALAIATPALAAEVTAPPGPQPPPPRQPRPVPERPLTPAEREAGERKIRHAERYLARADAQLVANAAACPAGAAAGSVAVQALCPAVPRASLAVEARDQVFGHYCGPAVGQVIANWAWAMGPGANKYTQGDIARWMLTDVKGQTTFADLANGLDVATARAPRTPAGWDWVVIALRNRGGHPTTADELHGLVRANVSGSGMPLAFAVKPHDATAQFRLTSWPRPVNSVGHWIAAYGWYAAAFDGTDFARIYYTDSSRDEGGSTGKFWDPTRHLAWMIGAHTGLLVW